MKRKCANCMFWQKQESIYSQGLGCFVNHKIGVCTSLNFTNSNYGFYHVGEQPPSEQECPSDSAKIEIGEENISFPLHTGPWWFCAFHEFNVDFKSPDSPCGPDDIPNAITWLGRKYTLVSD